MISITCALLATLLQQWARRYLKVTQPRYSPHKRARIRTFFFEGVEKCLVPLAVEALPTLLHVSLFLFFAGLAVFLCNVNLTIFKLVLSWIGVCTALYGCITFMPIFYHDSPYYTPLSILVWQIVIGVLYVVHWFRQSFGSSRLRRVALRRSRDHYHKLFLQGMDKTAEGTALNSPSEIDTRAFMWTFDSLDEDHELERFFAGLPGFRSSKVVDDPLPSLTEEGKKKLSETLTGFLNRTFSSDLLPEPVKSRRAIICAKALDPVEFPNAYGDILFQTAFQDQYRGLQTVEFGRIVRGWGNSGNQRTALLAQATASHILTRVQQRDHSWFILASSELGVPETDLRDYAAHGDSLSFAILIHITCQHFRHYWNRYWPSDAFSKVLETASKFNVQDTSPELQHEFCALWNRIVRHVQNDNAGWMAFRTLGPIRNVYVSLHEHTDSAPTQFSASTSDQDDILREPSSYPLCNVTGHIHDDSVSTTFVRTVLHDYAALPSASLASPDAPPSLSIHAPLHVVESLMDVPPLDNFHPAHQTTIESLRVPVTSPDPATAGAIRDIVTSAITIPHPTPETSASPLSSTSPPAAVALQHNADLLTPSDPSNFPSSAASNPVLDNILPIGPPLSSHSPITRSNLSPSYPESHCSTTVTTAPSASPGPTSAPDLGAAAEDDGSPKHDLRKGKNALDPVSVNRAIHANTMGTLNLPPQFPPLPSVTDLHVAIVGPSLQEPNAEHTGDDLPHPSHSRYDIV